MGCAASVSKRQVESELAITPPVAAENTLLGKPILKQQSNEATAQQAPAVKAVSMSSRWRQEIYIRDFHASTCWDQDGTSIEVHVNMLGGETYTFEILPSASLSDLKAEVHKQIGRSPGTQRLLFGATPLLDGNTSLEGFGIVNKSALTLIVCDPLGQSFFATESGKKQFTGRKGTPKEVLNEFELLSWQAARECDRTRFGIWAYGDQYWANVGGGLDFYWTLGSDGCRYEYWSSDLGDNEYGILLCVDSGRMRAIGKGSDDGICVFEDFMEEFRDNEALNKLLEDGWPRFRSEESDSEEDEDDG